MKTQRLLPLLLVLLASWLPNAAAAQTARGVAQNNSIVETTELGEADRLFLSNQFAQAEVKYRVLAEADHTLVAAQIGLVRSLLMQLKLDEAVAAIEKDLADQPNSPRLLLTRGDVQFRIGKIPEAEKSYIKAQNLNPNDAASYIGLARVYRAYSLYRHAYDELKRAHELAPNDIAVQLLWFNALPTGDRIPAVQEYLAGPGTQNPQVAESLQHYLVFLKRNADAPSHPCRLVNKVTETNTKLLAIPRAGMRLGASGLEARINKQAMHLAIDTGASGVLIGRTSAEKAGLTRLAYQAIGGMGDSGQQGGYTAVADSIRIGDLEFRDCVVRVTDAANPVGVQDGLIGTDVFSSYLVDFDIPGAKLRLSPLPPRPDETAVPATLKTDAQNSQELERDSNQTGGSPAKGTGSPAAHLPKDAYVAPEMANWTKIYRFGNLLLIPTLVDRTGPMLFLIDTGSFGNVLSTRAAREVTEVQADPTRHISGLSGNVSKVYRADKAALQFGRYEQQNQDIVTFDLTTISKKTGTEVSGILGFAMLRILQIKIDYRDGMVDFLYDPKHLPKEIRLGK